MGVCVPWIKDGGKEINAGKIDFRQTVEYLEVHGNCLDFFFLVGNL